MSRDDDGSTFVDDFDGDELDRSRWVPHYLPAWSSRAETAATHRVGGSHLTLDIPADQPLWCAGDHQPPLRVSGIQSGSWSGPVGSERGQQCFRDGQLVREHQPHFAGWLPAAGHVAVRARMRLSPRSMAALWLSGFEDDDEQRQCGELCVVEVFGSSIVTDGEVPSAEIGMGVKSFRDPALTHDFEAPRLAIDVGDLHTYAVDWDARQAVFSVDGVTVRRCADPPTYPMQVMLAVFDFPARSLGGDDHLVPALDVDWIRGSGSGSA